MARQRTQIAGWRQKFGQAAHLLGADWAAPQAWLPSEQVRDRLYPLLRLERAGAVDHGTAGLRQHRHPVEQPALKGDEAAEVARALEPWHVRMPADGAGGRT